MSSPVFTTSWHGPDDTTFGGSDATFANSNPFFTLSNSFTGGSGFTRDATRSANASKPPPPESEPVQPKAISIRV